MVLKVLKVPKPSEELPVLMFPTPCEELTVLKVRAVLEYHPTVKSLDSGEWS